MTTDRELTQKLRELKQAKTRLDQRAAKRPQSALNRSKSTAQQPQSTAQRRETDLKSVRVLRQALENPDLPAGGRRAMENSLRRIVRTLEGKPAFVGGESRGAR